MPEGVVHHPQALTNVSNKYRNGEYVADRVMQMIPVTKEVDRIATYGFEHLRVPNTRRSNGAGSKEATFSYSFTSYNLQFHSLKDVVTQRDRDNADAPLDPDIDVTEALTDMIQLRKEIEVANTLFTVTAFASTSITTAGSWVLNTVTSDPTVAIHSATAAILLNSAKRPNKALLGFAEFLIAKDHGQITDRIKYTERGVVTSEILASLWDLDEVIVGSAVQNTGAEGIANSNTSVWTRDCLVFYQPPTPGKRVAAMGYLLAKGAQPFRVKRWRDESVDGDWVEVSADFSPKLVGTACAYLLEGVNRT